VQSVGCWMGQRANTLTTTLDLLLSCKSIVA
jgi:hypothetical protein